MDELTLGVIPLDSEISPGIIFTISACGTAQDWWDLSEGVGL